MPVGIHFLNVEVASIFVAQEERRMDRATVGVFAVVLAQQVPVIGYHRLFTESEYVMHPPKSRTSWQKNKAFSKVIWFSVVGFSSYSCYRAVILQGDNGVVPGFRSEAYLAMRSWPRKTWLSIASSAG